jgi:predicted DNA-binding transcriptional regulator AlpA
MARGATSTAVRDELIDSAALSEWLDVPLKTIYFWRSQSPRCGPRAISIGRSLRFRRSDVEAWLEARSDDLPAGAA